MVDPNLVGPLSAVAVAVIVAIAAVASTRRRGREHDSDPTALTRGVAAIRNELGAREALTDDRLARIEQMIEVLAVEVERIGESQRYVSRILTNDRPHD